MVILQPASNKRVQRVSDKMPLAQSESLRGILIKADSDLVSTGQGPRVCIYDKLPDDN